MRVIFMGTPELARASLQALLQAPECQIIAVVTQPDRPKGRQLKLHPSPVKELALSAELSVLQPQRARDEHFIQQVRSLNPDLIAVTAYGQILPKALLDVPRFGCLNVHTSLLPKFRGAAPIQWALLNDEAQTGVTIMKMDPGLDTGDILAQQTTPIEPSDDAQTLHDRLASSGADLLVRTIPQYTAGKLQPRPQPSEGVTYAPKIKKSDGKLDWTQPARALWNRVRGLVPWPGAFTFLPGSPQPHLLKIWKAEPTELKGPPGEVIQTGKSGILIGCAAGSLRLMQVQLESSRRMTAPEFLAGHPLLAGQRVG